MEPTSSTRSAPPPYTSNLPDLDLYQQSQHSQSQTARQQQQVGQQPQLTALQQPSQLHHVALQQAHQLIPQCQSPQYSPFPQGYIPQPQPQPQQFYYQYPPPNFAGPIQIYPIPAPVFYHPSPYPTPYFPQLPFPQPYPIEPPPQTYEPLILPFQFPPAQAPSAQIQQPQPLINENMQIIQAASQAGFLPHPPAIIPGMPGVHQYPLIVRKDGEGPPPEPVFVDVYAAAGAGH